jgi:hypothetical protein
MYILLISENIPKQTQLIQSAQSAEICQVVSIMGYYHAMVVVDFLNEVFDEN